MIQHLTHISLEAFIGALFVVFYAFDRFGKPPAEPGGPALHCHSRATTTAAAYYTAVVLYCAAGFSVYASLLLYPAMLDHLSEISPDLGGLVPEALRQSPPVVVALLLTVLLPKVPVLAGVDEFFRTRLQHMAAIPNEVRRLAAELRRAPFQLPDAAEQQEITALQTQEGFEIADLQFEPGTTLQAAWMRLTVLLRRLEGWDADGQLQDYFLACPGELAALRDRYEELRPKARRCFSLSRQLTGAPPDERSAAALTAFREDVSTQVDAVLRGLYDAVSRAVLLCDLTHSRRARRLLSLGFEVQVERICHISLNSLMLLFTAGSVLFTLMFVVSPRPEDDFVDVLLRSTMISAIYCTALWCAVMPKSRWVAARRQPEAGRPWTAYLLSALVAAVAGVVVSFVIKLAYCGSPAMAWQRSREAMPWAIMTFAVAYVVALLADDEPDDFALLGPIGTRPWLVEGLAMAAAMLPIALFVHRLIRETTPPERVASVTTVVTTTLVVAFAIGSLVPSWYRESPRSAPQPRLMAAPATATTN